MTAEARPFNKLNWAALALAGLAFATCANTLGHGFVADDFDWIVSNDAVRDIGTAWRAFTGGQINNRVFRPIPLAWFTLDYVVARHAAWFYHLENVLLHVAVTLLVYRLLRPLGSRAAWLAAAFFAVLPVHTEVVANVTSRSELLASALALLALLELRRPLVAGFLLMTAMLSKETAVAVPVLALLLWFAASGEGPADRLGRGSTLRRRVWTLTALLAGIVGYILLRLRARCCVLFPLGSRSAELDNPLLMADWPTRARTAMMIVGQNLGISVAPYHLSADYSYNQIPLIRSWLEPQFLLWALLPVVLLGVALFARRRHPNLLLGAGWFLVAIGPVSNLAFPIGTIRGERLLYLPSVGVCLLLGQMFAWLQGSGRADRRRWAIGATALLLLALGVRAADRNRVWESQDTLTAASLRDAPQSARAHFQAGALRLMAADCPGAVPHFRRALRIFPEYRMAISALAACFASPGSSNERGQWPPPIRK
jgi:hypothetical protein